MKKLGIALSLFGIMSACGGSRSMYSLELTGPLPSPLESLASQLELKGVVRESADTTSKVLSLPGKGARGSDESMHFELESIADDHGKNISLHIDILTSSEEEILVGRLVIPFSRQQKTVVVTEHASFDLDFDDDNDFLTNLEEILISLNPRLADTDGDGVSDGEDFFPSLASEWADLDSDGIGDGSDDDMDGDGLSNFDEDLLGTDRANADSDADVIIDGDDNCRLRANTDQQDTDGDSVGDACEDDADGDGLSDIEEHARGTDSLRPDSDSDGVGDFLELALSLNPLSADTDHDGISDQQDNCGTHENQNQVDDDGDGVGNVCDDDRDGDGTFNEADLCPDVARTRHNDLDDDGVGDDCDDDMDGDSIINQNDTCPRRANLLQDDRDEDEDGVFVECDLDDNDASVHDESAAVFVDGVAGRSGATGTRTDPFQSVHEAVLVASQTERDVYVAAGRYDVSGLLLPNNIGVFGGFFGGDDDATRFLSRNAETILFRSDGDVALQLVDAENVRLNGFVLAHESNDTDALDGSRTLLIEGGNPIIERSRILGSPASDVTAVVVRGGSSTVLSRNLIESVGEENGSGRNVGVRLEASSATLSNNIIVAGPSRFAMGVEVEAGEPTLIHNTIHAQGNDGVRGTAEGVSITDASPLLINNLILTENAPDQYGISCWGIPPSLEARVSHNLLAVLSDGSELPLVRDCNGDVYFDASFTLGSATVEENENVDGALDVSDIIDNAYFPLRGIDRATLEYEENIVDDYYGTRRPQGEGPDIGAVEANFGGGI